jgi:nicotinamidase-related amidase
MLSPDGLEALRAMAHKPAVVTIDLHRGHLDPDVATLPMPADQAAALMTRVVPLLERYRELGLPIFHVVTSYRDRSEITSNPIWRYRADRAAGFRKRIADHNIEGMPGVELMPGVAQDGDRILATKRRYDSFVGTDLEFVLRSGGHDSLLLMGVNTNSCVLATSAAASSRDFAVFVVDDGCDSMLGRELHEAAESVITGSFGWVVSAEQTLEALDRLRVAVA